MVYTVAVVLLLRRHVIHYLAGSAHNPPRFSWVYTAISEGSLDAFIAYSIDKHSLLFSAVLFLSSALIDY